MLRSPEGFTLVELLVAVIVTALLALAIGQVMSIATRNVATTMDNTVVPQSTSQLINQIRYDAASALSVTAFGSTAPTSSYCSSKLKSEFSTWVWSPSGSTAVLRSLVNFRIPTPTTNALATWSELTDKTIGYEIRREAGGIGRSLQLWRIECVGTSVTKEAMMLDLGNINFLNGVAIPYGGGFPDGSNFITCPGTVAKFGSGPSSISTSNVTFSLSEAASAVNGEGLWFLDMSKQGVSVYGTSKGTGGSSLSITPLFFRNSSVSSSTTLSLTGARYLMTRPCSTGVSTLFVNNAYLALNIPYFGRVPGVRNLPLIVLKSRLI